MKNLLQILFVFLILSRVSAQDAISLSKNAFSKNKVKTMVGTSYEIINGELKQGVKSIYRKLNEAGVLVEEARYNLKGETIKECILVLDEQNNIKKSQTFENHKSITQFYYLKKDAKNNVIEQLIVNPDKSFEKKTIDYDAKGNIEDVDVFDSQFGFSRIIYGYNEKAQLTLTTELTKYNEVYQKVNYKYDEKGNLVEISSATGEGAFIFKYTYTYLPNNLIQWETSFNQSGSPIQITKYTYEYYFSKN